MFVITCALMYEFTVKKISFREVKKQEARSRMAAIRKARRSPQAAAEQQRRASLVGNGAKWRITNLKQVAQAIANSSMIEVKQSAGEEWVVSVKSTVTTHHCVRVTKKMSNAWLRAGQSKYCSGEQFWNGPVVSRERAG